MSENFQGNRPVEAHVDRLINGSHAAAAQLADHAVSRDPPSRFDVPAGAGRLARA